MARSSRSLSRAVLVMSIAAIIVPIGLAALAPAVTDLPVVGAPALLDMAVRSTLFAGGCSAVAALLAALVVVTYQVSGSRAGRLVLVCACAPVLVPAVVVGIGVQEFIPFGTAAITGVLTTLPVAVIAQTLALRFTDPALLVAMRDLGLRPARLWRVTVGAMWSVGATAGWAVGSVVLLADPSLPEVFGSTHAVLALHALRAVTGGAGPIALAPVLACLLLPTALIALWAGRLRRRSAPTAAASIARGLAHRPLADFPFPAWLPLVARVITAVVVLVVLAVLLHITILALDELAAGPRIDVSALTITAALLVVVLPVAAIGAAVWVAGILGAGAAWRPFGWWSLILAASVSPAVVGIVHALAARGATRIAADAGAGGLAAYGFTAQVALALAAMGVCTPLSALLMALVLATRDALRERAARTLGAGPARTLLQVTWPAVYPAVAAALCVQAVLILTASPPVAFLQSSALMPVTAQITVLAAAGERGQACLLATITGAVVAASIVGIVAAIRPVLGPGERRWRRV